MNEYKIVFYIDAENDEDAINEFYRNIENDLHFYIPHVEIVEDEDITGIKPEGTI
tara:strand:+ start:1454 stop:1618 length:165 start_codon:yes stop_codon:yes gene_type:complete